MNKTTLEVNQLHIGFRAKGKDSSVAKNIDFRLREGELGAIVGVNGIGKSTLLRTLGKVQPALGGNVQIQGKALAQYSPAALAREVSLVLTDSILSKNMTVMEMAGLGRFPYTNWLGTLSERDREQVDAAIDRVGLRAIRNQKCYELSDGQFQKTMIARALAQDTSLMLLDEPTTHLDLHHKVQILKMLRQIAHESGRSVLFTTHEIELAIQLCDKILILDRQGNPFDAPCKLIEQGYFESMFPRELVRFDPETGSFRICK